MLQKTAGIVLRSVKYGDTSLVTTVFTEEYGVQAYMVQGVRSTRQAQNRAGLFQPGTLLQLVVYHQPNKNLQRIREYTPAYIYTSVQEHVVKNSIVLFSAELLLKLLPENAPLPSLFELSYNYYKALDEMPIATVANFPLYFIIACARELGYELKGRYSAATPYLNMQEGGYADHPPGQPPYASDEECRAMDKFLAVDELQELHAIELSGDMRLKLIDWYTAFLQQYTQHMGNLKSLSVLRAILH